MTRRGVLGIEDGAFFHGVKKVFSGISFLLDAERTALVGENGVGKSTLLKCLAGELELNRGRIVASRGLKTSLLPQEAPSRLMTLPVYEILLEALARGGAVGESWRADVLLSEVGLDWEAAQRPFAELSGGWQRLVLIAAAVRLEAPDILLLDEPTNHLDIGAINTLERWLLEADLPMLIISHDRAFLERVSTRTLFLRSDGAHPFKAPFARAREELLLRDVAAAARLKLEEREIARLQQVAARYHAWGVKNPDFHKRQKATETRIERLEAAKTKVHAPRVRRLELNAAELEARSVIRLGPTTVRAPDAGRELYRIERMHIGAGDRVALLGANGAGKSSLLRRLAVEYEARRDAAVDAEIRFNPACRLAFFDQRMEGLPLRETLADYLGAVPGLTNQEVVRRLAQAGFAFARIAEPISLLSFGERARLIFLRLRLEAPNLYLLDEPTSHLDIEGQEALESQLAEKDVACVFVSHDRWFVRAAASRFWLIEGRRLIEVDSPEPFFDSQQAA